MIKEKIGDRCDVAGAIVRAGKGDGGKHEPGWKFQASINGGGHATDRERKGDPSGNSRDSTASTCRRGDTKAP